MPGARVNGRDFSRYVGIPFKRAGRDPGGLDCYGLVLLVAKEVYGINAEDMEYGEVTPPEQARLFRRGMEKIGPRPVETPREGCAVVTGSGSHIGIYIGGGLVLHSTPAQGSVIDPIEIFPNARFYDFRKN